MEQRIIESNGRYGVLDLWFKENCVRRVLLVCGRSIQRQLINEYFEQLPERLHTAVIRYMDFKPNPLYESVTEGVKRFRSEACDAIIAVGGGSAIDVAKCIKLYSNMEGNGENGEYLKRDIIPNEIPFLAIPTTSGTGSEATRFAVIYYNGSKQSVSDTSCIPETVLLDAGMLKTLPSYQKKSTMLDALCHAIESFWSVNSTDESLKYSRIAIETIMDHMAGYLNNTDSDNAAMLMAANTAGRAINITQTTAGHAMCYKITGLFGCAHGHAAALCDRVLYPWMIENTDKCCDPRGERHLIKVLDAIAKAMGCENAREGAVKLNALFDSFGLEIPSATPEEFYLLKSSVNPIRLRNHPVPLDENTIDQLYHKILNGA